MTTLDAYNMREIRQLHTFFSTWLQAERSGQEPPEGLFRSMGFTKKKLEELFRDEDERGMKGLRAIVGRMMEEFTIGKKPEISRRELGGKPFIIYDFGKYRQMRVPYICVGIKPDESRWRKYAEWFFFGRDMEHARGTMVVKHPNAPLRPHGVPHVDFHLMTPAEKVDYKRKYYEQWQEYSKKWGDLNKEVARKTAKEIESKFEIIDAYPSHLVFEGMQLTATSHVHTFIPHTDLEGRMAEVRQNSYRFQSTEDARRFLGYISKEKRQINTNSAFMHLLTKGVLPFDNILLFEEDDSSQCLVARDGDVVIEVIAPMISGEYESQMYYIPRIAMLKKRDHVIRWPNEEEAALNLVDKISRIKDAEISRAKWLPKMAANHVVSFENNFYLIFRAGNATVETRFFPIEDERRRIIDKFRWYGGRKKDIGQKETTTHYLDVINPLPVDLSLGWFVHKDTRHEVFRSRHSMEKDPDARGIRSTNYFSNPKRLPHYGRDYLYMGSINVDIMWGGAKYEFQIVTPESLIENEIGEFSREKLEKIKKGLRDGILATYFGRLSRFLDES